MVGVVVKLMEEAEVVVVEKIDPLASISCIFYKIHCIWMKCNGQTKK